MGGDYKTMNKINFASKLHVGKYPKILNQHYFFVFNEESSVSTYNAIQKPKVAATTLEATQLTILIEIFNSQSIKTPVLILLKKSFIDYSNQEKFNSYVSTVETCLPVLSNLKSPWTIIG